MRAEKIRELSNDELRQKQTELTEASFHLRLRRATGQLANPMKVRETKRDLARVLTILGERARRGRGGS
jgi:large subunit ribosomal protein L29